MEDLDARIDALFAGAPGEFTASRDALAKELRAAGQRDEADRVRALRRPSKTAAELNRLARAEPEAMEAAIAAAEALGEAQRRMLDGTGGADELRAAEEDEARATAAVAPDPGLRAALRLAARSGAQREDLRRGRLTRDPEPETGGLFGAGPAVPRPARAPAREPAPRAAPARARAADAPDELAAARARRERERRREEARRAAGEAANADRAAAAAVAEAQRRREDAEAERDRAAAAVEDARTELERAERELSRHEDAAQEAARAEERAQGAAREAAQAREDAERAADEAEADPPG